MKLLIVEDEEALAAGLAFNFKQEGYAVTVAMDGRSALNHYSGDKSPFDVIILDLMLPGMSGYDVCREIRKQDRRVPILILSARQLPEDRTLAFDAGTDQYLSKPFSLPEVISRVKNLLARRSDREAEVTSSTPGGQFQFDGVTIDFDQFQVVIDRPDKQEKHELTTLEAQLLRYFIQHEGRVLPRMEILENVWPPDSDVTTRTIDNFVMRLRRMIEADPANPQFLLSVRGTGYKFRARSDS
ncbi:response regulator transcription factor [Stratiformator vulcanicus]|uniref:Sensory transduction protein regX3 n=1 Tax=Stratiformator vulcanicus TaxID=2527980 RepID=A0A517R3R6_9PLAN|nr:response regulator transcription factor [Stratiformator vulcanicus]QDT38532.1 Sensory transduction protein regX3 [Stratiformator vulcanicus]